MSTTTQPNDTAPAATALQIVAKVALLAHEHKLPNPVGLLAYDIHSLSIELNSRAALAPWLQAMGLTGDRVMDTAYDDNRHGYWATERNWAGTGWTVQVKAIVVEPAVVLVEPLDADTVAGLEEIAAETVDGDRVDVEETKLELGDVDGFALGRAAQVAA